MSGHASPVIGLAEQIADQFRHVPPEEAAAVIARHIRMFWDPRMRVQLAEQVTRGDECDPLVIAALGVLQLEGEVNPRRN